MALLLFAPAARAACVNKFTHHDRGPQRTLTLLTGKLSFQNALALAAAIRDGRAPPIEWLSETGRSIAKQYGELKVVRPMPVGCEGNTSGVVMIAVFVTVKKPEKNVIIKFDANTKVDFQEQE
ncbi:MAG TPA: hypothetical protein VGK31_11910 [Thermoanaerobaculia bacterium]